MSAHPLDALAAAEAANPCAAFVLDAPRPGGWGAEDWQRRLLHDPARLRLLRGGNKIGKSTALALETWLFLLDQHPVWRRPRGRPAVVLYVAADLEDSYADDVARSLHEFRTAAAVDGRCSYDPTRGYIAGGRRQLLLRGGHRVVFRSGHQDGLALSGVWADMVVVNEPPRRHLWGEIMRAAANSRAPVLVGLTPLPPELLARSEDLSWLREVVQDPAGGWSEHVVPLRPEHCRHRTPESLAEQIAAMPPWERAQRRDADWEGPAPDRRFGCFDDARCTFRGGLDALPAGVRFGLGGDHGELTGREAWVLGAFLERGSAPDAPRAWVLDAYVSAGRTTVAQDAARVAAMVGRWGLDLRAIARAVADVGSAGKSSAFRSLNAEFESAFADLAGGGRPPFHVQTAEKGPGSVDLGWRILDESFGRETGSGPALMVHEDCEPLLRFLRRWQGRKDETLHVGDGARYLFAPILREAWSWGRGPERVPLTAPLPAVPWASGNGGPGGTAWDGSS